MRGLTRHFTLATASLFILAGCSRAGKENEMMVAASVTDEEIAAQRAATLQNTRATVTDVVPVLAFNTRARSPLPNSLMFV